MSDDNDHCEVAEDSPAVASFLAVLLTILLSVLLLTSCICNPIVFWYQRFRSKQNLSSILYQILTFFDFFTCLLTLPLFIYTFAVNHDPWYCQEVKTWQIVFTVAKMTVSFSSIIVTAVLGVMRAVVLNLPFYKLSLRVVLVVVAVAITLVFSIILGRVYTEDAIWHREIQCVVSVSFMNRTLGFIFYIAVYFLNVAVCAGSAWMCHLGLKRAFLEKMEKGLEPGNECHSCKTMIYLNSLVLVQFIFMLICAFTPLMVKGCSSTKLVAEFLATPFSNSLLSAINPLIIIIRSKSISRLVRSWMVCFTQPAPEPSSGAVTQQTKASA